MQREHGFQRGLAAPGGRIAQHLVNHKPVRALRQLRNHREFYVCRLMGGKPLDQPIELNLYDSARSRSRAWLSFR